MGFIVCELELAWGRRYVTRTPPFSTLAEAWSFAVYRRYRDGARVWIERELARAS